MGLPSILMHKQGRKVFLALYIVVLGVVVPYFMYHFWTSYKKAAGPSAAGDCGCLAESTRWLMSPHLPTLRPHQPLAEIPNVMAGAAEGGVGADGAPLFARGPPWPQGSEESEELRTLLAALTSQAGGKKRDMDIPMNLPPPMRDEKTGQSVGGVLPAELTEANNVLLGAHLARRPVHSAALRAQQRRLVVASQNLVTLAGFLTMLKSREANMIRDGQMFAPNMQFQKKWVGGGAMDTIATWVAAGARIVQALGVRDEFEGVPVEFRQVFSPEQYARLRRTARGREGALRSLRDLLELPAPALRELVQEAAGEEGEAAGKLALLQSLPVLAAAATAFVELEPNNENGEGAGGAVADSVCVGDLVTLRLVMRHANLMGAGAPPLAAAAGPRPPPSGPRVPPVHAPLFPELRREEWQVWIEDVAAAGVPRGRIVMPNATKQTFHVWTPARAEEALDFRFMVSNHLGPRKFVVHFHSTVYLGLNVEVPIE